ncbi:hypothetical protein TNCV_206341 [Trichonephila clavipes]|nr:hypothetical protein TNCV_206341 [Trichonephila clavipes]
MVLKPMTSVLLAHATMNFVGLDLTTSDRHFDVKDAPRPGRPVVENVDKITEIIEVNWHVSSRGIAQKLKIDDKAVLKTICT